MSFFSPSSVFFFSFPFPFFFGFWLLVFWRDMFKRLTIASSAYTGRWYHGIHEIRGGVKEVFRVGVWGSIFLMAFYSHSLYNLFISSLKPAKDSLAIV